MFDLIIKNVRVVRPNQSTIDTLDIGIRDGKFARLAPALDARTAAQVLDGQNRLAFPGAIDAHTHVGIYRHVHDDALSESKAAASGGVTTLITYARTGSLYLNMGGSLKNFCPELLRQSADQYYVDYGYHISPIQGLQVGEMEYLATEFGAPNYGEVFMFYGLHGLHGVSDVQSKWLMLDERDHYDLAHFDFICREAARLQRQYPSLAPYLQVSFHCETPEILRAYEHKIRREKQLAMLEAYSAARPPHSEALAISIAASLAHHAGLTRVNILHITSRAALDAALHAQLIYPEISFGLETTAGHLLLDDHSPSGVFGKVNPPLRSRADVEYLWSRILDGSLQWVVTDHANCPHDLKIDPEDPENIWGAKAGFGGTEYLLPGLFSEGTKRGLSPNRIAELVCWNPARHFGLLAKGDIAIGYDADLALLDPAERWTIHASDSFSTQGYTPFENITLNGRVKQTFVRGSLVYDDGKIVGEPIGVYLKRPTQRGKV